MLLNRPVLIDTGEVIDGRPFYQLDRDLVFQSNLNGHGVQIRVPAGFLTDLASTPRLFWWIFPPAGPWSPATILHDYLYGKPQVSRFFADAIFREAMFRLGVPLWRRLLMYYAVRLFGRGHKLQ